MFAIQSKHMFAPTYLQLTAIGVNVGMNQYDLRGMFVHLEVVLWDQDKFDKQVWFRLVWSVFVG